MKVNRLLLNNIDVVGVAEGTSAGTPPGALCRAVGRPRAVARLGPTGSPEPVVYPLDEAAAAIASLENRTAKGKVVLRVRD